MPSDRQITIDRTDRVIAAMAIGRTWIKSDGEGNETGEGGEREKEKGLVNLYRHET